MPTPLTNENWGFETNCFVCEPTNPGGLKIPFQIDDDGTTVSATFTLDDAATGAPTMAHGGISLAILDEVQAWATIGIGHRWAMTRTCSATFESPVMIGQPYRAEGEITAQTDSTIETAGRILDADGTVMVHGTATFVIVGEATVVDVIGSDALRDDHRSFLHED